MPSDRVVEPLDVVEGVSSGLLTGFVVMNNPLSLSDPSGFFWWNSSAFRSAIRAHTQFAQWHGFFGEAYINKTYGYQVAQNPWVRLAASLVVAYFTFGAAGGGYTGAVASGFAAGGITGGNIQSALTGAFTSLATFGLLQGLDGLAGAAGGAEVAGGGLATPSPAIDYLRNADGTATSFAEIKFLNDGHLYDVQPWVGDTLSFSRVTPTNAEIGDWFTKGLNGGHNGVSGEIWRAVNGLGPVEAGAGAAIGSLARLGSRVSSFKGVTYLYQKLGAAGEHLKYGITNSPATR